MMRSEEKGTILCVEDNSDNRTLVRRILQSEDYKLVEAKNASEALDVLKDYKTRSDLDGYQYARHGWLYINRQN